MLKRLATYAIEPKMNKPSIIIKPFDPEDEMRNLYLPSSKAASYFSFAPYPYNQKLWAPVANLGHTVEELLINKYFPGQKNNRTFFYTPLSICATPDVITSDGEYIEIKTVQKKSKKTLDEKFEDFFYSDGGMNLEKVLAYPKKSNILSNIIQCLFALYILNECHEEQKDTYYLIYSILLTNENRAYRIQINNTKRFRGWIKILAGMYEMTEGKAPFKKDQLETVANNLRQFLSVNYEANFFVDLEKKYR